MARGLHRRAALGALATAGFAAGSGGAAFAAPREGARSVTLAESSLSGASSVAERPSPGEILRLEPAPERRFHDGSLGARDAQGRVRGYLPMRDARLLAPLLAAGHTLDAEVIGPRGRRATGVRLILRWTS